MNKQPVYYSQKDTRWKDTDYSTKGESTTIGKAGCGPTCAAMLIQTIAGKTYTPVDACKYSLEHGYKAKNQGTYYSYFVPQFKEFGIECERLNTSNLYGNANSSTHAKAFQLLKQGYYLIACMGKGTWTSSGHFIVVWWEDGKVRINDPNSTKENRTKGDIATFKSEVKYYWAVKGKAKIEPNTTSGGATVDVTVNVLKKGNKGNSVKVLQILLNGLGYDCGDVDGDFGNKTLSAVQKFQKAKVLLVDGTVGAKTWAALLNG